MNFRRTRAVARKEFLHILRDARSLAMALAMPLMMLLLFGYALTLDVDHIPTVVYDSDQSPESRDLIARFRGSRYFEIKAAFDSYRPIEKGIDNGSVLMGIVIPRDFSRDLLAGREAVVQLLIDGSDSNTGSIALGYAEGLVQGYAMELRIDLANRRAGNKLVVNNNLQRRTVKAPSNKVGLDNIKTKYALLKQTGFQVMEDKNNFTVVLPLIWNNSMTGKVMTTAGQH